ncbi:MAG TPA: iron ABC transporter permease [Gemmatimonadota bacterium]|nr:iron ABC transporter permease [Gemmatimonadota bacterium]
MSRGAILAALAALVVAALAVSLRFGAVGLGWEGLWQGLKGTGDPSAIAIARELRLPRAVLAAMVGGTLGLAGATFQALLRNPLAEPYVLGVSGGAAVGAVVAIGAGWAAWAAWTLPLSALGGALVAIVGVLRIARGVGRGLDVRILLLAGVVAGTFFNAVILLLLSFQEAQAFRAAVFWMMGSVSGATWPAVVLLGGVLLPSCLVLLGLARAFNLLAAGEETAGFLGVRIDRVRLIAYVTASILTAGAVVVAGGIGFVGLFAPHTARLLWGGEHRLLLPAALLLGAAFLPLADTLARIAVAPAELPLGVVTAFVGVPFFIGVLRRQAGEARS